MQQLVLHGSRLWRYPHMTRSKWRDNMRKVGVGVGVGDVSREVTADGSRLAGKFFVRGAGLAGW